MKKLFLVILTSLSCSLLVASDNSQRGRNGLGKEEQKRLLASIKEEVGTLHFKINTFERTAYLIQSISPEVDVYIIYHGELNTFCQAWDAIGVAPDLKTHLEQLNAAHQIMNRLVESSEAILRREMQKYAAMNMVLNFDNAKKIGKTV